MAIMQYSLKFFKTILSLNLSGFIKISMPNKYPVITHDIGIADITTYAEMVF